MRALISAAISLVPTRETGHRSAGACIRPAFACRAPSSAHGFGALLDLPPGANISASNAATAAGISPGSKIPTPCTGRHRIKAMRRRRLITGRIGVISARRRGDHHGRSIVRWRPIGGRCGGANDYARRHRRAGIVGTSGATIIGASRRSPVCRAAGWSAHRGAPSGTNRLPDALECLHPGADFADAAVVPELDIAAAGHRLRAVIGGRSGQSAAPE